MRASYDVLGTHFVGDPSSRKTVTLEADKIMSMVKEVTPSPTSYGHGENYFYTQKGDDVFMGFANRGVEAYTVNDVKEFGLPTVQAWEENASSMRSWIAAANKNRPSDNNLIPVNPEYGYSEGIKQIGIWLPNKNDTNTGNKVTPQVYHIIPINRTGTYVSKTQDSRELLLGMFNDPRKRLVSWYEFLDQEKDVVPIEIPIRALAVNKDIEGIGYLAAFNPDTKTLITEANFYNNVARLMKRYGLTRREAITATMQAVAMHEIRHSFETSGEYEGTYEEYRQERKLGYLQYKFYSKLAEENKGTPEEKIFRTIAAVEGSDYAKNYTLSRYIWNQLTSNPFPDGKSIDELVYDKASKEADVFELDGNERGMYIKARMDYMLGPLNGGTSYKGRKTNNAKNRKVYSKGKGLEQIIDESGKITVKMDGKGRLIRYHEGNEVNGDGGAIPTSHFIGIAYSDSKYKEGKETYERRANKSKGKIDKSKYKSMDDVKRDGNEAGGGKDDGPSDKEGSDAKGEAKEAKSDGPRD